MHDSFEIKVLDSLEDGFGYFGDLFGLYFLVFDQLVQRGALF